MAFKSILNKLNLFSYKLLLLSIAAMGLMAVTTGYTINKKASARLSEVISKNLVTKGDLQIENAMNRMGLLVEENSFSDIEKLYTSILQNDSDFVCANYIDVDGNQWLTVDYQNRTTKIDIKPSTCQLPDDSVHFYIQKTDSVPMYVFNSPVIVDDEKIGNVLIVISSESMIKANLASKRELLRSNLVASLASIVGFSILLIVIVFVISKRFAQQITLPLYSLSEHAKLIASGDFNSEVDVVTNDEVGVLAQELESMRKNISTDHEKMTKMVEEGRRQIEEIHKASSLSEKVSNFQDSEVSKIKSHFDSLSSGNLDFTYSIEDFDAEIGDVAETFEELAQKLNFSVDKLSDLIGDIKLMGVDVEGSSQKIYSNYEILTAGIYDIQARSNNVSDISADVHKAFGIIVGEVSEISSNITLVNSETQQMANHMKQVGIHLSEIIEVINSMTKNYKEVVEISSSAVEQAGSATKNILTLEGSANEIGDVTDIIKKIATQTNLLALNATIEAASAGDAGKGFAVVAAEIKELADQSASAAEDIYEKINTMQKNTTSSVKIIKDVSGIIYKIQDSSSYVTENIKDLSSASEKISDRINLSTEGIARIAQSIDYLTSSSNDVSSSAIQRSESVEIMVGDMKGVIQSVENGIKNLTESSGEINELGKISTKLKKLLSEFTIRG